MDILNSKVSSDFNAIVFYIEYKLTEKLGESLFGSLTLMLPHLTKENKDGTRRSSYCYQLKKESLQDYYSVKSCLFWLCVVDKYSSLNLWFYGSGYARNDGFALLGDFFVWLEIKEVANRYRGLPNVGASSDDKKMLDLVNLSFFYFFILKICSEKSFWDMIIYFLFYSQPHGKALLFHQFFCVHVGYIEK